MDSVFVLISLDNWGMYQKRPMHLALELARRGWPVFYVQLLPFRQRLALLLKGRLYSVQELGSTTVVSVNTPLPQRLGGATRVAWRINSLLVAWVIQRLIVRRHNGKTVHVISNNPLVFLPGFLARIGISSMVYDCMDDYSVLWGDGHVHECVQSIEDEIVQSGLCQVSVVSKPLQAKMRRLGTEAAYIPNGVDVKAFRLRSRTPSKKVKFGYVGTISWWFDFEMIRQLLRVDDRYEVVLYGMATGHGRKAIQELEQAYPGRVTYKGVVPYCEVPRIMEHVDVGLIPFRRSALVDSVSPLKLYEYFASGLPVLSAAWPELEQFWPLVQFYNGPRAVENLGWDHLSEVIMPEHWARERRMIAEANTWSQRTDCLLRLLGEVVGVTRFQETQSS